MSLLTGAALIIVFLVASPHSAGNLPSHDNNPVTSPTPIARVMKRDERVTAAHISTPPISKPWATAWLEMPSTVRAGITIPLILRVMNVGARDVEIAMESVEGDMPGHIVRVPYHSFRVTDLEGDKIWDWKPTRSPLSNLDIGYVKRLPPGKVLMMKGRWQQMDNKGNRVSPGTYFVQGFTAGVKTQPETLTIVP